MNLSLRFFCSAPTSGQSGVGGRSTPERLWHGGERSDERRAKEEGRVTAVF